MHLCGRRNVRPAAGVSSLWTPRSNHRKMKRRNGAGANQNTSVAAPRALALKRDVGGGVGRA